MRKPKACFHMTSPRTNATTTFLAGYSTVQWRSQITEKVMQVKERLLYQALILYNYCPFQIGTSLKGNNLLPRICSQEFAPRGSKFFPFRAVPCGMGISFATLGKLPSVLLYLLRTSVYCVMGATPMLNLADVTTLQFQPEVIW